MVCHPDCRARCRHRVYLQVLPPSRMFCRPLFKGGFGPPGTLARLPSLSRLFFLRGRVLGRPRGGRWGGGPCGAWPFRAQALRRSPACRGLRASACALPAACKFHSPATRLAFPGSAPLINLFGLTRAE